MTKSEIQLSQARSAQRGFGLSGSDIFGGLAKQIGSSAPLPSSGVGGLASFGSCGMQEDFVRRRSMKGIAGRLTKVKDYSEHLTREEERVPAIDKR